AEERAAGRLHIEPSCMWSGGEYLAPAAATEIERALGCALINEYGASECMSIAFSCGERALHVNSDWVVLVPVDRDFSPTSPAPRTARGRDRAAALPRRAVARPRARGPRPQPAHPRPA